MKVSAAEWYEDIMKMCKVMQSLGWTYTAEGPASAEKISEFEKETGCQIPDEYKEWLGLTASLTIDDCDFSLYMPEDAGENEKGFRMFAVGSVSAREYFINADSGKMFVYDDLMQKTEEFDSLDDMITDMYARIEMYADEDFGDEWQDAYDEMFPEE